MKNQSSILMHFDVHVTGDVQGVCFRAATRERAEELGLKGFVRNEPDGSVFIEVEGFDEDLADFTAWCQKGPPSAHVENVSVKTGALRHYSAFTIRYF